MQQTLAERNHFNNDYDGDLHQYISCLKDYFPKGTLFKIDGLNGILAYRVAGLSDFKFRVALPMEKTKHIAKLPSDIVSVIIPQELAREYESTEGGPVVFPIYPSNSVELAILSANKNKRGGLGLDTLSIWLHDAVLFRTANLTPATVEGFGDIFIEVVKGINSNGDYPRPVAYRTSERFPDNDALVIDTKSRVREAPGKIIELLKQIHADYS